MTLGLEPEPPARGRPRKSLRDNDWRDLRMAESLRAKLNAIALDTAKKRLDAERKRLDATIKKLRAKGAAVDNISRAFRAEIPRPSPDQRAEAEREVAKEYGVSVRSVQRADQRCRALCSGRAWVSKDFEIEGHRLFRIRQRENAFIAKVLGSKKMPKRRAADGVSLEPARPKNERYAVLNGGVTALDNIGQLHTDELLTTHEVLGLRHFAHDAEDRIPFKIAPEVERGSAPKRSSPVGIIPNQFGLGWRRAGSAIVRTVTPDGKWHPPEGAEGRYKDEDIKEEKAQKNESRPFYDGEPRAVKFVGGGEFADVEKDSVNAALKSKDWTVAKREIGKDLREDNKRLIRSHKEAEEKGAKPEEDKPEVFTRWENPPKRKRDSLFIKDRAELNRLVVEYQAKGGIITVCPLGAYTTRYGSWGAFVGRMGTWRYMAPTWRVAAVRDTRHFVSLRPRDQKKLRVQEGDEAIAFPFHTTTRNLRLHLELIRDWTGLLRNPEHDKDENMCRYFMRPGGVRLRRYVCENAPIWGPLQEAREIRRSLNYWRK